MQRPLAAAAHFEAGAQLPRLRPPRTSAASSSCCDRPTECLRRPHQTVA